MCDYSPLCIDFEIIILARDLEFGDIFGLLLDYYVDVITLPCKLVTHKNYDLNSWVTSAYDLLALRLVVLFVFVTFCASLWCSSREFYEQGSLSQLKATVKAKCWWRLPCPTKIWIRQVWWCSRRRQPSEVLEWRGKIFHYNAANFSVNFRC